MESLYMLDHELWMAKAQEDFNAARILCRNKHFPSAMYHCQQATEKALKSYLFFKKQELIKTHDLVLLCARCKNFDHDFQKLTEICELLNPFATKFRYPSEFDLPNYSETKEILKLTKKIIVFVDKKIIPSLIGQMELL